MLYLCVILAILLLIGILWILAIKPNKITDERREKMKPFQENMIAHRGLFSNKYTGDDEDVPPEAPENSLEAFRRAVEHGYGIEMDVQLTKDDKLVVFHDGKLKRICGKKKTVLDYTYEELKEFRLLKSDQHIPLFQEVIDLVQGRVPLLIEVKPEGTATRTCQILDQHLQGYEGIYCMESFDPRAVNWYRKHRPDVIRGQLSTIFKDENKFYERIVRFFLTCLACNFWAKPDFISYNHKYKNQFSYRLMRKLYPAFHAAWTIRSQEQLEEARDVFSTFIFDSFIPDK